jgi:nitrite reductase/ring-hydroxylating ferredoxin subunit
MRAAETMSSNDSRRWRPVALSSEVPAGKPVRVLCASEELVLFRDASGNCRALTDRCAHRRAALSGGRLTDHYLIECPYHGWRYNGASGACVAIPNLRSDEQIPKNYRVQSFETVERDGFIQVLLPAGGSAEPHEVELPSLDRHWEGERFLAYPDEFFMSTLVDCPSSILAVSGIRILDDHPFGDPVIKDGRVTVDYAAIKAPRSRRPPKHATADFAYTVRISASRSIARIAVHANDDAQLCAAALLVAVPVGQRITRALWRGSGRAAPPFTIACRNHVDPIPVRASNGFVSRSWAGDDPAFGVA